MSVGYVYIRKCKVLVSTNEITENYKVWYKLTMNKLRYVPISTE